MSVKIQRVEYFYTMVEDRPGEAYRLLDRLSSAHVDLLAFQVVPFGPEHTQMVLFPRTADDLFRFAERSSLVLTGPQQAFLVQGKNETGALVDIHLKLADAHINVYKSEGVADGRGGFGYVCYVRPGDFEQAARVLGV